MGAGRSGKAGACWREPTKDKGFAERSAPTWAPANREKPGRVGVNRRREKKNTEQLNHCSAEVTFFFANTICQRTCQGVGRLSLIIIIYI